jgi:hypothetical protein
MSTKKYQFGKGKKGAKAIQADLPDGEHQAVGIGNMRVFIVPDGKVWFAQGLEIDYATQGDSLEVAKENFSKGLAETIDLHLQMNGCIDALLQPSNVLQELSRAKNAIHNYSQVSIHDIGIQSQLDFGDFQFAGIDFYQVEQEVA